MTTDRSTPAGPLRVVVMGVSGSGKSTVGRLLAGELGVDFADGDDFHGAASIAKMSSGIPLDDDDRLPWLESVGRWLAERSAGGGVVTCSALRRSHRNLLREYAADVWFLHCAGEPELIARRLAQRSGHFMPATLLTSQLAALESPGGDERAVREDVSEQPGEMVADFLAAVADHVDELEFQRLWGPWEHVSPAQVRALFDPVGISWWIAGGYCIEAFTGVPRQHGDIDVSIFRRDLPVLRAALEGRLHIWSAGDGLRPVNDDFPEPRDTADQVWLREHALSPWRVDVLLNPDLDGRWVSRRDTSFDAPLDDVTWERDGIRYLRPEIALAFKAKLARRKDERDFAATLPLLDGSARAWLADYLDRCEPGHSWRQRL
jgi:carbohydrate kinase (thermoresistant glucokinase family)